VEHSRDILIGFKPTLPIGAVVAVIYGSWIYNYLCNQCLSPLMLWVWISIRARCTTLYDKVCQWLRQVGGFLRVLRFPPPKKLTVTYTIYM